MTHCHTLIEGAITIKRDLVYNQTCGLSLNIHVKMFDYLLIFFLILKLNHHKILAQVCHVAKEFFKRTSCLKFYSKCLRQNSENSPPIHDYIDSLFG